MSPAETGGPAFPVDRQTAHGIAIHEVGTNDEKACVERVAALSHGMTLRQYAAIKLRVPESGADWLDAMILQSRRDELAESAVLGLLSDTELQGSRDEFASRAYQMADAMLAERQRRFSNKT